MSVSPCSSVSIPDKGCLLFTAGGEPSLINELLPHSVVKYSYKHYMCEEETFRNTSFVRKM